MKNLGNLLGEIMQLKCDIRIGFSKFNEIGVISMELMPECEAKRIVPDRAF